MCNNCWGLIIIYPYFIWLKVLSGLKKTKRINEFTIGCMINQKLNINKAFKEQVHKCMNNIFYPSTQLFIRSTLKKRKQDISKKENKSVSIINVL